MDDTLREYLEELLLTHLSPPPNEIPLDLGPELDHSPSDIPQHAAFNTRPRYCLAKALKKTLPSDRKRLTHLRLTLDDTPTEDPLQKAVMTHQVYI